MKQHVDRANAWVYRGVWGILAGWFRVPQGAPDVPLTDGEVAESFRPSEGFLRYLKFTFWVGLLAFDGALLIAWLLLLAKRPGTALALAPAALVVGVLPDLVAFVAIHLRYDTMWYVVTSRSLRIRRGIWTIHETTITFENIQNVRIEQGPLQRFFRISDVAVETAGGGAQRDDSGKGSGSGHRGLIEGIAEPGKIRDRILETVRRSRSAGLGDDIPHLPSPDGAAWRHEEITALREIRDALRIWASHSQEGP